MNEGAPKDNESNKEQKTPKQMRKEAVHEV
jgi:hypothetical protein